jgi:hypothetical protein
MQFSITGALTVVAALADVLDFIIALVRLFFLFATLVSNKQFYDTIVFFI